MLLWLVTLSVVCAFAASAPHTGSKLPTWIPPCRRNDPEVDKCATESGQITIPRLVKGDRKIRLPVLDPLEIVEMKLDSSVTQLGLDLTLSNVSVGGLANTVLTDFHTDFENQHYVLWLLVPNMEIISTYNVSGRILVLPITGAGPGNFTLKNVKVKFQVYCNVGKSPKDGKDHMKVKDYNLTFNTTHLHVRLDNLFNGDKLLGSTMNQFLNDNWKELIIKIGSVLSEMLGGVLIQSFNTIAELVPYDDIFPPS